MGGGVSRGYTIIIIEYIKDSREEGACVQGAPVGEEVDHQVGLVGRLCAGIIRLKKKNKSR